MKSNHSIRIAAISFALFLALCTPALMEKGLPQSQTPAAQPRFAIIEYFKIEPGKNADYNKLQREVWMPIHRERIKMGVIKSWSAWSVRMPGGSAREYDRVIITTFDKFSALEIPYPPEVFTKVFPNTTAAELIARTGAVAKQVRSEIVTLLDSVTPNGTAQMPKFAEIGFQKAEPGKGGEYVEFERKYFKPLHQERVNRGILNSWNLYSVRYPGGANREYGHITINFFDKFEHLETQYPADLAAKLPPNMKPADLVAQTAAVRKSARIEVLNLVDQVQ